MRKTLAVGVTQWFLDCELGPKSLKRASELGFSAIHINAGMPHAKHYLGQSETIQDYRNASERYGVRIVGVAFNSLETTGLLVSEKGILDTDFRASITTIIESCITLEIPLLYFPSFHLSQISNMSQFQKTVRMLQYACDYAQGEQLEIVSENTLNAKENMALFKAVNRKKLKLLFDTQNPFLAGHCPLEIIEELFPVMTNQIHIKDGLHSVLGSARLGTGEIRLEQTLQKLVEKGFSGSYILENDYREDAEHRVLADLNNLSNLLLQQEPSLV